MDSIIESEYIVAFDDRLGSNLDKLVHLLNRSGPLHC